MANLSWVRWAVGLASVAVLPQPALAQTLGELDRLIVASLEANPASETDLNTRPEQRVAIIVGNAEYLYGPDLQNAYADAVTMAEFLAGQGYDVLRYADTSKQDFEHVLRRALQDLGGDAEVVFFYAGHGLQIGDENYLVPTDADLDSVYDIPFETVSLSSVTAILGAQARQQIVIIDAFRETDFGDGEFLIGPGPETSFAASSFAMQVAPPNSLLILSTSPGRLAFDGVGDHSPFTEALLDQAVVDPDGVILEMMEAVRSDVMEMTEQQQLPWHSSTLLEPARFGVESFLARPSPSVIGGTSDSDGIYENRGSGGSGSSAFQQVAGELPVLNVLFGIEVPIGISLRGALGVNDGDIVVIETEPELGRLVLIDENGLRSSAVGRQLSSDELGRVVFLNHGRQIRAETVSMAGFEDGLTINHDNVQQQIALRWVPNLCDFEAGDHLDPDSTGLTRYANEMRPQAALEACVAAVEEFPEVGRFHYQLGRALRALSRLEGAQQSFDRARELGHARAWVALGNVQWDIHRRDTGDASGEAPEEVLALFARGVEQGDPYAFHALGRQFLRYGATPEIVAEGFELEGRALEVGHTFAMNLLGFYYLDEDNPAFDPDRGLRYLRESAARADIYGYNNLGVLLLNGRAGLAVDTAAAFELFQLASDGGHPSAPSRVGRMHYLGDAPDGKNVTLAMEYMELALSRGQAYGGVYAAFIIENEGEVEGYTAFDRAAFLARAATLNTSRSAVSADEDLDELDAELIAGGAEVILRDLGVAIVPDGEFSEQDQIAMEEFLTVRNLGSAETDPTARLRQLGRVSWLLSPYRQDLY